MNKSTLSSKINNTLTILLVFIFLLFLTIFPGCTLFLSSEDNQIKPDNNSAIIKYEPAVAVRASGCLTCHAKISSNYITDFGYGSPYFFTNPASKNKVGIFNGHIYGDFTAGPGKTGWLTANFQKKIIVPEAPIDFNLKDAAGNTLTDKSLYEEALKTDSLAGYLRALENKKNEPAQVIEKKKVFIGAPDRMTLENIFEQDTLNDINLVYRTKDNQNISHELKGIKLSDGGKYFTNTGEIVCNGDLYIDGILFLDKPIIVTETGCRIYATESVFLQEEVAYKSLDKKTDKSNLQIVSSEAIFLGVGKEKCDTTKADPLSLRLLKTPALPSIFTRATYSRNITPQEFMQNLYDKTALVPLEDSSCHDETIGFSRLLLNAPVIHSRYSGLFKGVVIAEFALFWQGKTNFEFDPIFKEVPVLPLLKDSDYLSIE